MTTTSSLDGWDVGLLKDVEWMPSSTDGNREAKLLAVADRFHVMLADAHAGVRVQSHPEFHYLIASTLQHQGRKLSDGATFAAAASSIHPDLAAEVRRRGQVRPAFDHGSGFWLSQRGDVIDTGKRAEPANAGRSCSDDRRRASPNSIDQDAESGWVDEADAGQVNDADRWGL